MIFFTGSYPLYHSTLYSDDIFKNTFIAKSSSKAYSEIEKNFDLICEYESRLSNEIYNLSVCTEDSVSVNKVKNINSKIENLKQIIFEKTLETQNSIIVNCFNCELNLVRTLEDVEEFENKLENFNTLLINTENYNFYNDFCADMTRQVEEKKEFILKYGNILTLDSISRDLSSVKEHTYGFQFFQKLFDKLKLLVEETFRQKEY